MSSPAYRVGDSPASREAFYAIACDPSRSAVVEACAGAGKTWMLVSRILRALIDGAQPQEILAITFTRKAAGEMRERLDEWLREFAAPHCSEAQRIDALCARGVAPERAAELAPALQGLRERLLQQGRPVAILTFHAWFSQLLRAAPRELLAELSLPAQPTLIEDTTDHAGEVFLRFHAACVADPALRADFETLVRERGRTNARKWLQAAWDKRVEFELADEAGVLEDSVPQPDALWPEFAGLAHPAERLRTPVPRALLAGVAAVLGRHANATPRKHAAQLEEALGLLEADAPRGLAMARAALLTDKGQPRKQLVAPDLPEALALLEHVHRAACQHDARVEHLRLVRLARVLLREYAAYKRARGLTDMADLERGALALLRDAPLAGWVQERLDARIRHVLIDEFQDTSPLQWHALHSWLSAYAGAGGGTSGHRPPAVFIVGDPKQSIYRFRRAEPRVFQAAQDFVVEALDGVRLACDHTRRNTPGVLQAINAVFEPAVRAGAFSGFRPHTTEVADGPEPALMHLPRVPRPERESAATPAAPQAWRDSLAVPRIALEERLRQQEARRVAQAVHELVASGQTRPGEVFVLCRTRPSLRLVAEELAARHLPFAAVEAYALMDAAEARDLVALLDVLASPQHKLSLAQALRSPVFGVGDDDLMALARRAGPGGDWWRALMRWGEESDGTQAGGLPSPALGRARTLLADWHAAAQALPPHDLLDRIVAEGALHERVAAAVPSERRMAALGAVDALLAQALLLDGARYATPYNFVRALKRRALQVAAPVQPDAVQLLTVHGAKGLEARTVFVMDADPEAKNPQTATVLVDWPVQAQRPLACAFVASEAHCPPSLQDLLAGEMQARQREELNGLYVALSRARERLVFSATQPFHAAREPSWWQRIEALAAPWPASPVPLVSSGSGASRDAPAVLRRMPAWSEGPAAGPAAPPTPAPEDSAASRLGRAVHRVLEWATAPSRAHHEGIGELAAAAAQEFAAAAGEVERLAQRILGSVECARFFTGPALQWAGNEVSVGADGEPVRIDRLVALHEVDRRVWWVLDYKLHHTAEPLPAWREQMARYREAVCRLQPGEPVRCGFITGAGVLIEV